jgi:CTP:molybdopterin cytidylyltransferase MocA
MPLVEPELIAQVAAAARRCPAGAAAARARGRPGHPVAFVRRYFSQLAQLKGDRGARGILAGLGDELALVDAPPYSQWDVDTPRDLERIRRHLEGAGA